MYSDVIIILTYLFVFQIAYFIGSYSNSKDKEDVKNILRSSTMAMKSDSLKILTDFKDNLEAINYENIKIINEQNAEAVSAINRQIRELNGVSELLANINLTLKSQSELYERINMLQKIIVKKKNIDIK